MPEYTILIGKIVRKAESLGSAGDDEDRRSPARDRLGTPAQSLGLF